MNIIKGFVTISQYVNNVPGEISPIAELSSQSRTYSKELGEYVYNEIPGYKLTTFKSIDSVTGFPIPVESNQVNQIIALVRNCVEYSIGHIRPFNPIDFKNVLQTTFYQLIADVEFGEFIDGETISLPEWISWTNTIDNLGNKVKIWLSDNAFAEQYDEYEITVIPPLTTVDNFMLYYQQVVNELQQVTLPILSSRIETAKQNKPETFLRILDFPFVNTANPTQTENSLWAVLIYGKAGDNIDTIKDTIVDYILERSQHNRTTWESILPELFKRTEFVILPRWDKVAIPNQTTAASLYSSMLEPNECINFAVTRTPFYGQSHVQQNITIMPFDYKALSLIVINGNNNLEGKTNIQTLFADYLPISSSSLDFNRMQVKTRDWLIFLERLLIAAETVTAYSTIPTQFRRIVRNNILYITGLFDNINYLVAARSNTFYGS